jgi:NAD-dependent deacetylase
MNSEFLSPCECAEMIRQAERIVVLTGAGISTAAGIPDFRGPKGLYVTRRYDPERVFNIESFKREPGPFYEFTRDFMSVLDTIEPTFTHYFLAELEAEGKVCALITQNIDVLHQQAGSRAVIPLHGGYWTSHCLVCGAKFDLEDLKSMLLEMLN